LFFKKKRTPIEKFTYHSLNKREAFRFEFDSEMFLETRFKNKKMYIINLSATGISFKNQGFSPGDSDMIKLKFEFTNNTTAVLMNLEIEIIKIDDKNICHGIYKNCPEKKKETIHKYILEKQKEKIRKERLQ